VQNIFFKGTSHIRVAVTRLLGWNGLHRREMDVRLEAAESKKF
jgi:hypothetical protein